MNHRAQAIVLAVADEFGFTLDELRSRDRRKTTADARAVAYLVLRNCARMSYPEIGETLARDHTSVITGVRKATLRVVGDAWFGERYERLRARFQDARNVSDLAS